MILLNKLTNITYKKVQAMLACIYYHKYKQIQYFANPQVLVTCSKYLRCRQDAALGAHYNFAFLVVASGNVSETSTWILISADALLYKLRYCMQARRLGTP